MGRERVVVWRWKHTPYAKPYVDMIGTGHTFPTVKAWRDHWIKQVGWDNTIVIGVYERIEEEEEDGKDHRTRNGAASA